MCRPRLDFSLRDETDHRVDERASVDGGVLELLEEVRIEGGAQLADERGDGSPGRAIICFEPYTSHGHSKPVAPKSEELG